MNEKLYRAIFLGQKIGPEKVMISPTDFCNLRCKICWRLANQAKCRELPFKKIEHILKDCKDLNTRTVDLTGGGEAFFRRDIFQILETVKDYDFIGTLTSNGTLLDMKRIEKIIRIGWDDISFSLDNQDAKINDYIRGEGTFQRVIKTIINFKKAKKRLRAENPFLRITTVINKLNYENLDGIIEIADELEIEAINFSTLVEFKTNQEFWMRGVNEKRFKSSLRRALRKSKKMKIHTNLESIVKFGVLNHEKPKFCFAPWSMAFINASGEVMVCCTLASLHKKIVGNIQDSSFMDVWFGRKMEEFREKTREKKLPKECERCVPEFIDVFNKFYEDMKC